MRALVLLAVALAGASPALGADGPARRFAIVAGASLGGPERVPLRYATSDARDVARVLRRLGGVALDDLVLVEEPDADRLRGALRAVSGEAERTRAAGRRVELFLYYSGHSDEDGLLLGPSRLPYAELRRALDAVPADVRVAILDSCASGAITRAKGGTHRPPFLLDASSRVEGHAFLTSSAANEAAQESDRLRASFFTHALLTGLRGAADTSGDGVVTLNEAYQFAFRETLASTEATQSGPQHATYDIGLVGSGDVVMTDLRRADALLVVPEPVDGKVFVRNASGQLVAELRKVRGARIELALEEGRYTVQVVQERRIQQGSVDLVASGRAVLDEARLTTAPLAPTAARGGPSDAEPLPLLEVDPAGGYVLAGDAMVTVRGGMLEHARPSIHGWALDLAWESWRPDGFWGFEIASGLHRLNGTGPITVPVSDTGPTYSYGVGGASGSTSLIPGTLTLKIGLPDRSYRPHLLAGAGFAWIHVDREPPDGYDLQGNVLGGAGSVHESSLTFGVHVGAGIAFHLDRRVSAVIDARYTFWMPVWVGSDETRLDALAVTAGVSIKL
jgi:hypothetical protein